MFHGRASALAKGKLQGTDIPSLYAKLAEIAGTKVHAALTEKNKGLGRYFHQSQVVFYFKDSSPGSVVEGILTGTPDMYWYNSNTLYVVEWKTISKKELSQ